MKTYGTEPTVPDPVQVGIAELAVVEGTDTLKSYGLGSCLAVVLYDPGTEVGGLAHVMLPSGDDVDGADRKPGKYADTAIRALLRRMVERGANYVDVEAKLTGGSDMFEFDSFGESVGRRNVDAARAELEKLGVPIAAEDVGGSRGRTVEFTPATGAVTVRSSSEDVGVCEL